MGNRCDAPRQSTTEANMVTCYLLSIRVVHDDTPGNEHDLIEVIGEVNNGISRDIETYRGGGVIELNIGFRQWLE